MKHYIIFLLFLLMITDSFGQKISIIVFEGIVSFENIPALELKTKYEIEPSTKVSFKPDSRFIIYSKTKMFKADNTIAATMDYKQIKDNLISNATTGFLKLMSKYHELQNAKSEAFGSIKGAGKGLNDKKGAQLLSNQELFFPKDSARTSAKSLELSWKLKNSIMGGRLYVINQQTKDTIYNQPATSEGKATLNLDKSGNYNWFIYSKMDKKKRINQTFIKQSEEENKKMLLDFDSFKKDIALMEEELKAILLEEYKLKYGIIE